MSDIDRDDRHECVWLRPHPYDLLEPPEDAMGGTSQAVEWDMMGGTSKYVELDIDACAYCSEFFEDTGQGRHAVRQAPDQTAPPRTL